MCNTSTINHNMVTTVSQLKIFIIIQIWTSSALYQNILFPIVVNIICHHTDQLLRVSENLFNLWFCHQSNDFYAGVTPSIPSASSEILLFIEEAKQFCIDWLKETQHSTTLKTVLFGLNCFKYLTHPFRRDFQENENWDE